MKNVNESFDVESQVEIRNFCRKYMNYRVLRKLDMDTLRRGEAVIAMVSCKFREYLAVRERQSAGGFKRR